MSDENGNTALQCACDKINVSMGIISKLLEMGGRELLNMENTWFYSEFLCSQYNHNDISILYVRECILADVGGEFGIGGLFNNVDSAREIWREVLPILESVVDSLQEHQKPPILHAAILAKAPLHIIKDIINHFEFSILQTDSLIRCPLVIALEEGLEWNKGLQQIIRATAIAQHQHNSIYTAAQYGLKWTSHMKELAEGNGDEMMNGYDSLTGLRVFMMAALGDYLDLSSIYGMMRMSPDTRNVLISKGYSNKRRRQK